MNKSIQSKTKSTYPCPECDNPIIIEKNITAGEIIECNACGTESEVVSVNPITLAALEEEK